MKRSHLSALLLALTVAGPLLVGLDPAVALAQAPAADAAGAKARIKAGDEAFRAKDYVTALAEYRAANAAQSSALSLEGVASSAYLLGRSAESHAAYAQLLDAFGKTISKKARDVAVARLKELAAKTGLLTIRVSQPGAAVLVGGDAAGTSPLAAPVRVEAGAVRVRATMEGFAPAEQEVGVLGGGSATVDLTLAAIAAKGRVVVKEKSGKPARVFVDDEEVGPAPWEGDLDVGVHEIRLASDAGSVTGKVDVAKGATQEITLVAATTAVTATARLEVKTSDGLGSISLDGEPIGEGAFAGDVGPGEHVLRVTRDGFEPFEKKLTLEAKHTLAETVTLRNKASANAGPPEIAATDEDDGFYGGASFLGAFAPFGTGSDTELRCTQIGAAECTSPSTVGGGLLGYFGYAGGPLGIELALGALFDQTTSTATYTGQGTGNPLSIGVPRDADFTYYRVGPMGAVRLRATARGPLFLVSAAGGAGISQKTVFLQRDSRSTDGRGLESSFAPGGVDYLSPALTFDLSAGIRPTPALSVNVGLFLWFETASEDLRSEPDGQVFMENGDDVVPLASPSYRVASGTQTFLGPYVAVQFGP